jgi:hypothetical protein
MHQRIVGVLFASCALSGVAAGQECPVPSGSNEAKLLAYYAAPLTFSPSGAIGGLPAGAVRLGFEVTLIPAPGNELRRTSRCFLEKEENSQLSSVFPRPHLAVGLPAGFFAEAMYLPPVTVGNATANMASIALGVSRSITSLLGFSIRAHTTFGQVKGPITCPEEALQQQSVDQACFGVGPSEDTYRPNIFGGELALSIAASERVKLYGGGGYASLSPRFRVGFLQANGYFDRTLVTTELSRLSLMAGGSYQVSSKAALTGELYSVPDDMTTIRLGGSWRIR